jgi:3-dehydroquinate dehydratase-2
MTRILVINGPNLNVLGRRNPGFYGAKTLDEINQDISAKAESLGVEVVFFQSNVEGEIINCIQENWGRINGIIINPGALTTYGYSLKDALIDAAVPIVEVHLSNIHARDEWRRHSVIADVALGQIAGFGWRSYTTALEVLAGILEEG